jgi:hypothetical protein
LKKDEEKLKPSGEEPKVELKSEVEPVFKVEEQKVTAVKKESKVAFPAILSSPLLSKKHHPSPLSFSFSSNSHEMVYQGSKILHNNYQFDAGAFSIMINNNNLRLEHQKNNTYLTQQLSV